MGTTGGDRARLARRFAARFLLGCVSAPLCAGGRRPGGWCVRGDRTADGQAAGGDPGKQHTLFGWGWGHHKPKHLVPLQAAFEMIAARFPGAFTGYSMTVREAHQSSKARAVNRALASSRPPTPARLPPVACRWTPPARPKRWWPLSRGWAWRCRLTLCACATPPASGRWACPVRSRRQPRHARPPRRACRRSPPPPPPPAQRRTWVGTRTTRTAWRAPTAWSRSRSRRAHGGSSPRPQPRSRRRPDTIARAVHSTTCAGAPSTRTALWTRSSSSPPVCARGPRGRSTTWWPFSRAPRAGRRGGSWQATEHAAIVGGERRRGGLVSGRCKRQELRRCG